MCRIILYTIDTQPCSTFPRICTMSKEERICRYSNQSSELEKTSWTSLNHYYYWQLLDLVSLSTFWCFSVFSNVFQFFSSMLSIFWNIHFPLTMSHGPWQWTKTLTGFHPVSVIQIVWFQFNRCATSVCTQKKCFSYVCTFNLFIHFWFACITNHLRIIPIHIIGIVWFFNIRTSSRL